MDRKTIVRSLSEHFGTQARYLGTPTLAYEVEALGEVYRIDKRNNYNSKWNGSNIRRSYCCTTDKRTRYRNTKY